MSLNWNVGKIASWKATGKMVADCNDSSHDGNCQKCPKVPEKRVHDAAGNPISWGVTNGLIWATMALQLGGITEKNAKEFAVRVAIYQRLHGPFLTGGRDGKGYEITTADVFAHVGLSTNVSDKSRAYFMKAVTASIGSDAESDVRAGIENMKAADHKRAITV